MLSNKDLPLHIRAIFFITYPKVIKFASEDSRSESPCWVESGSRESNLQRQMQKLTNAINTNMLTTNLKFRYYGEQVGESHGESNGQRNWSLNVISPAIATPVHDKNQDKGHHCLNNHSLVGENTGLKSICAQVIRRPASNVSSIRNTRLSNQRNKCLVQV